MLVPLSLCCVLHGAEVSCRIHPAVAAAIGIVLGRVLWEGGASSLILLLPPVPEPSCVGHYSCQAKTSKIILYSSLYMTTITFFSCCRRGLVCRTVM